MDNKGGIFTSVQKKRQKRSSFNLSHDVKLSLDMGPVVPTLVQEVVPGDSFTIRASSMLRLAPLISPVMHKINVYQEFFFVPNRILWKNWETFITGSRNGKLLSPEDHVVFPTVYPYKADSEGLPENMENGTSSLLDYLGLPTRAQFPYVEGNDPMIFAVFINALPFAAYQRIWDEYYRDENLIESVYDVEEWDNYNQLFDGPQPVPIQRSLGGLRPRCWEHDYFTSALPWAQKGEQVTIPVDLELSQEILDSGDNWPYQVKSFTSLTQHTSLKTMMERPIENPQSAGPEYESRITGGNGGMDEVFISPEGFINTTTINDLRAAIKLQEWLETNARGGSRYFESIYAHFGVKSPDSRLQRPEFIGSYRSNMVISEILQTSSPQGEQDTPQGNMSGHGQAVGSTRSFNYYAQEHGFIIGLISVLPSTAYQQGIPKLWNKVTDRLDYYFPEFAHLGEQEILNSEIYAGYDSGNPAYEPDGTFGYTPRYAEYKFMNSRIAGDFRETLDFWHLARIFENGPMLNDTFLSGNLASKRIFAVQDIPNDGSGTHSIRDYDSIYAHVFFDIKASRLMPKYGTPSL